MTSLARPALLPQCPSCVRRVTRLGLAVWSPLQQVRNKSKAAKEAERNIIVKLLHDTPRFGRAGTYIPINRAMMRNRWFPARIADYVPAVQLKQLKVQGVEIGRDASFGADLLEEEEEGFADGLLQQQQQQQYVRPIEIELLSAQRTAELIDTFVPSTIDFARQPIEQDRPEPSKRHGASAAADIYNLAQNALKEKTKAAGGTAIYGSVSSADIVATIKGALAHNDEAARVLLSEGDVNFITGHEEGDTTRVKQLGVFQVAIQVPGAEEPLTRNIRIRAKAETTT
ncbi:hypothetical protein P280DRAFT_487512 [Massarina eburnea CBS 473.64]|uniref:Ribosomal protein L9 domain-containing protein n=1 Tax=Massarina eburnea CBS 473.64 TaxID=1395130 RepID=A0A6A6SFP8_9PLEO|nr:hypothetical protein P280DRAFT_487512 [Massarina eburnea CBS 473.64]